MGDGSQADPLVLEATGLTSAEAAHRLRVHGPNEIPSRPPVPVWRRVLQQLRDPLILVLLVAAALTIATGDLSDAAVILLVITVNTVVGVVQEVRAEQAVRALSAMSAPEARVMRDGAARSVPAAEVVPGDLVLLAEGDIVPADGRVVDAARLLTDESSLTGESVPVEKTSGADGPRGTVSAGTVVVRGRGRMEVTATGAAGALGRIAALMGTGPGLTPLQRRLVRFGRVLAAAVVVLCAVVLALGLVRGQPVELMIVAAISLAVAAVPESLPAVVTLSLALGARRMADRRAIVRRLPAVETLGSVTVIATDKTGTLTEGRMAAERLWTPHGTATVTGEGYVPEGGVLRDGRPVGVADAPDLAALLRVAMLCNDAALQPPRGAAGENGAERRPVTEGSDEWSALGDPTEAALLAAGARLGLDRRELDRTLPRVGEIPFDSGRKRMTTVHRRPGGGVLIACKGAPEVLLRPDVMSDGPETLSRAAAEAERLARHGYRVLAVASAERPTDQQPPAWESGLTLLGLVGIVDPPRGRSAETMAACRRAGIVPVLITGDHPLTARAVAERLGIASRDEEVTTGRLIREGRAGDLTSVRVFARTTPEQKLDIVEAWRGAGHVVAMTGDGVNDGPALRRADIGVAMGRRGTEVARQAADLVLADDNPGTIVAAVEEGRRVYDNVRRFLLYGLAGGTAEILVMLFGPFLGMPLPLLPAQILWINLLTHGIPGVALGAEPVAPDAMRRPPRPPEESVLGAGLWPRILLMGAFIATVSLVVGVWARETGRPWQSMLFLVLGATQLGVALGSRARPGTLANPFLLVAVGAALALQVAGVYLPPLRQLLGTEPLAAADLVIAFLLSGLGHVVMRLQTRLRPERHPGTAPHGPGGGAQGSGRGLVTGLHDGKSDETRRLR
ncbi:cation-transporting P-type ATPase [Streptomyces sp. SBST2-5]|uniref:Cation-transporting P-type ATPase n=1 Tax=Streptomyces composti TaxID=2720025 RepID=A0ABX1A8Q9_9ACTN|nr:cation-transporting P-type ATPase [Streptomyces composti]NJP50189.1 cation-transporting P-type ATPase [Streptomyces composti]